MEESNETRRQTVNVRKIIEHESEDHQRVLHDTDKCGRGNGFVDRIVRSIGTKDRRSISPVNFDTNFVHSLYVGSFGDHIPSEEMDGRLRSRGDGVKAMTGLPTSFRMSIKTSYENLLVQFIVNPS